MHASTPSGAAARPLPPRIAWIDTARGICAALIVLGHAAVFSAASGMGGRWFRWTTLFGSFPLPVFFFAAGVVGAGTVAGSFRGLRRRVLTLLWVYLLWSTIAALTFARGPGPLGPRLLSVLQGLVWPDQDIWFVQALAVCTVVARAVRSLPRAVQLVPALLVAVAVGTGGPWEVAADPAIGKAAIGLLCFLLAVHAAPVLRERIARAQLPHAVLACGVYLGAVEGLRAAGATDAIGMNALLAVLAIPAGATAAAVLARGPLGRPLAYVGRRSLAVYLLQFFPTVLLPPLIALALGVGAASAGAFVPPVLATAALGIALLGAAATARLRWLYALPRVPHDLLLGGPALAAGRLERTR